MNGTILNPAISRKINIWTAAIIINFIVKHHVLRTYQCRVLHENIKNYQYICFLNDSRYKVIKNVSYQIYLSTMKFLSDEKRSWSRPFL